ncbi:MAG: LLM class F420-dependent oxidoreductase [Alphaproteobacteria bacterium]|nr:LLM class F420-dependent oxidoreductase [Alphaproteobacteria bacterium]
MKYGISLIVRGADATPAKLTNAAERADAAGLDAVWVSDHLMIPKQTVSRYPGRADGQMPDAWKTTYYQPFSVLNYLAAKTKHVRLGQSILVLPMRNPIEVAAQIAEMDQLSGGRVNFGVGVGWFAEEFAALGYPFKQRGARTDEGLAICKALWQDGPATFEGRFFQFENAHVGPKPAQRPHPPIYVGGNSDAAVRRAAKYGDVWHPLKPTPEQLVADRPRLHAALEAEGRSVNDFQIAPKLALTFQDGPPADGQAPTQGRPQDIIDALQRYRDAGVTEICFDVATETEAEVLDTIEHFVQEVRPKLE